MYPVRGVILDVDGTLIDSNDAHALLESRPWLSRVLRCRSSRSTDVDRHGQRQALPRVSGIELRTLWEKEDRRASREIFKRKVSAVASGPTPGAKELLRVGMSSRGLEIAVASAAKKDELGQLPHICGADEVLGVSNFRRRRKPLQARSGHR